MTTNKSFIFSTKHRLNPGFTIVELLIVIVVIGVLAAITVVAFNGIQQRANNTKTIAVTKQIITLFSSYTTLFGANPANAAGVPSLTSGGFCLTTDNKCSNFEGVTVTSDNTALMNELKKAGSVPREGAPMTDGNYFGIYLDYNSARTVNGKSAPYLIMYRLAGTGKSCSIASLVVDAGFAAGTGAGSQDTYNGSGVLSNNPYVSASTPWSYSGYGGINTTECWISVV